MTINELTRESLYAFFDYLGRHLAENGTHGEAPFLPLTVEQSHLSNTLKTKFEDGLRKNFGESGWRRTWIALDDNQVIGHADIRTNDQLNAGHRVSLGLGVDRNHRGQHIGLDLLSRVIAYCKTDPRISWLDLDMIATNAKAKRLYDRAGFIEIRRTADMFRIDGASYDYISMALNVET